MMVKPIDYTNAKIYRVINTIDDYHYIGGSVELIRTVLSKHKHYQKINKIRTKGAVELNDLYKRMSEIGAQHFYIELLEEYKDCKSKDELNMRVIQWRMSYNKSKNQNITTESED